MWDVGRIRRQLRKMGLDWDTPLPEPTVVPQDEVPTRLKVLLGKVLPRPRVVAPRKEKKRFPWPLNRVLDPRRVQDFLEKIRTKKKTRE